MKQLGCFMRGPQFYSKQKDLPMVAAIAFALHTCLPNTLVGFITL